MCGKNFMLSSLTHYYTVILDHTLKENQMVSVQDSVILARGMLRDFRKTSLRKSSNILRSRAINPARKTIS